jgi:hypothetical protein
MKPARRRDPAQEPPKLAASVIAAAAGVLRPAAWGSQEMTMRALGAAALAGLVWGIGSCAGLDGAAQAQALYRVGPPVIVASDLDGPYDDLPPRDVPPPYARAYPPPPGPPPAYGPSAAYGPALPVGEIYRIVRNNGYSPLGQPQLRGNVVTITVLDEDGEDGRLVIDAFSGRIIRFVPAYSQGSRVAPAVPVAYGPPPATVPVARSVPLPKPRVTASLPDRTGTVALAKPPAAAAIPAAPTAALAAAPAIPPAAPPVVKPAFAPQPTQAMPPVQGID